MTRKLSIRLVAHARFLLDATCISCTSPGNDPNTLVETDHWKVVLHPDQTVPGALLLVTIRHVAKLSDLSNEEAAEFMMLAAHVESVLERQLGAAMVNFSCLRNWAYRPIDPEPPLLNGRPNPHVHWHVAPRYAEPASIAGETFVDQEFGEQLTWQRRWPSNPVRSNLIARITAGLIDIEEPASD